MDHVYERPEFRNVVEDQPYTREQIETILDKAEQRNRAIILLLSSSGMRLLWEASNFYLTQFESEHSISVGAFLRYPLLNIQCSTIFPFLSNRNMSMPA